jgi:hypothetical protein
MKHQSSEMKYDPDLACWVVILDGKEYTIHCGEYFDLSFAKNNVSCRLERDLNWYVIIYGVRFILHPKEIYMIKH